MLTMRRLPAKIACHMYNLWLVSCLLLQSKTLLSIVFCLCVSWVKPSAISNKACKRKHLLSTTKLANNNKICIVPFYLAKVAYQSDYLKVTICNWPGHFLLAEKLAKQIVLGFFLMKLGPDDDWQGWKAINSSLQNCLDKNNYYSINQSINQSTIQLYIESFKLILLLSIYYWNARTPCN